MRRSLLCSHFIFWVAAFAAFAAIGLAQELSPGKKVLPVAGESFRLDGHDAFVILPSQVGPDTPWVWYAPTLPGLPSKMEVWMFERFAKEGIAVAGIDVGESYGSPAGRKAYTALYNYLVAQRKFSRRPVLLARSRGGLMLYCWAAENADKVGGIAGIYPVCNILSYPGLERAAPAYQMTEEQLKAELQKHNPIDRLQSLAEAKVPIFHIHGDADKVVPLEANSAIVAERYEKLGGKMTLAVPKGQGHNVWRGWFENEQLTQFVIDHAQYAAAPQRSAFEAASRPIPVDAGEHDRWWKGNLHTHSLWSDGNDFPEMIADWYRRHDYHFLALSDHNILSQGMKWMKLTDIEKRNAEGALEKYIARFGADWVETRGNRESGSLEVRLKPLDEVRSLVQSSGRFLLIQSEEITDKGAHINATNIHEVIEPQGGKTVSETIRNNLRAVDEQAKRLGRTIIPHLNHPNLGNKGISAAELAALVQDEFFEVFNGVEKDGDLGSDQRHSLEALWDITSTLRISEFNAPPLFGLATDDSHHYHGGQNASPGRGWIRLRARRLSPESVVNALKRGDFYASSGVELRRVHFDSSKRILQIEIEPSGDETFTTQFIGTPREFDKTTKPRMDESGKPIGTLDYSGDVGKVFATARGTTVQYQMTGDELYVRATVTSSKAPVNPTSESPLKKAWTQPFGWRSQLAGE